MNGTTAPNCTCPSGNGSLRHPCPTHPFLPAISHEQAIKLARAAAYSHSHENPYLPQTWEAAATWQPHAWVISAIVVAADAAAPGIDLEQFREAVENLEWQNRGHANPDFPTGDPEKHAECLRLLALIDASPKGGSKPAQRIELTNGQIAQLADFAGTPVAGAPLDEQDVLVIQHADAGHSGPGLYAHYDELPEEGAIYLDGQLANSPKGDGETEPMFYIQDTRSFVGNCPVWWAPNGAGYVTRLDEAGRFTEQEAIQQNRSRDTDVPWPCAEIDKLGRLTVDHQHMRPRRERLAELQAASAEVRA